MILWLISGFVAGVCAKAITPQDEKGGWISSIIIGLIGSMAGGFVAGLIGLRGLFGYSFVGETVLAIAGAVLVLFIYHKFLADKLNLPL